MNVRFGSLMVTMRQLHVPQRCKCPSHHEKTWVDQERVATFLNVNKFLQELTNWSGIQGESPCFIYEVRKIEPCPPDMEIEFT